MPTAVLMILPASHLNMVKLIVIRAIVGILNVKDPLPVTTTASHFRMKTTRLTFISVSKRMTLVPLLCQTLQGKVSPLSQANVMVEDLLE